MQYSSYISYNMITGEKYFSNPNTACIKYIINKTLKLETVLLFLNN